MRSNVIHIDNMGNGHEEAIREIKKVAVYEELNRKESLQLQLLAEEMMSLLQSVLGGVDCSLWVETGNRTFCLYVSTETDIDTEEREQLLASSSSGKNEAAQSFLGFLREILESTMAAQPDHAEELPDDVLDDLTNHVIRCTDTEWDRYEQSTLKRLADTIKIGIRGKRVVMTVIKTFNA